MSQFLTLTHHTVSKVIYILHTTTIKQMINFLMMMHSVITIIIHQLCLSTKNTKLQFWMILKISIVQNLNLTKFITNQDLQNFCLSTNFLKNLTFPTLALFLTIGRHPLTNQTFIGSFTKNGFNSNTRTNFICNCNWDTTIVFSFHRPP